MTVLQTLYLILVGFVGGCLFMYYVKTKQYEREKFEELKKKYEEKK